MEPSGLSKTLPRSLSDGCSVPITDLLNLPDIIPAIKCGLCYIYQSNTDPGKFYGDPGPSFHHIFGPDYHPVELSTTADPRCIPREKVPPKEAFKATIKPCITRRAAIFKQMRKDLLDKAIQSVTAPEGQGPPPEGGIYNVIGWCKKKGYCYPSDEQAFNYYDATGVKELFKSVGPSFFLFWFDINDPNKNAVQDTLRKKWLTTGSLP